MRSRIIEHCLWWASVECRASPSRGKLRIRDPRSEVEARFEYSCALSPINVVLYVYIFIL